MCAATKWPVQINHALAGLAPEQRTRSIVGFRQFFSSGSTEGYLDVGAALANADTGTGAALSAAVTADPETGKATIVTNLSAIRGTGAIVGTFTIWGTNVFPRAGSAIWRTGHTAAFSAICGTSEIWGTG